MHQRYRQIFIALIAFAIALTACSPPIPGTPSANPTSRPDCLELDPVFRELYDQLGGVKTLGCIITPSFTYKDPSTNRELLCQYTDTALLVYDPYGSDSMKRRLAPIGIQLGIAQPPVSRPEEPGVRWVEGHVIYDKFVPLYERLGGMRYVGKPLTEVRYNPDRKRYEQYFENVGFYILDYDQSQTPGLLAYGVWMCDSNCRKLIPPNGIPIQYVDPPHTIAPEFQEAVNRLGSDFIDFAISDIRPTPDGYLEQVFDNIVLVVNPNDPSRVFPRAITQMIGILPDPPVERSLDPESYFVPVEGELGYNIPKQFMDYIALHGGLEITGQPITERKLLNNDIFRQCFQNLCLLEDGKKNEYEQIHPAQLGHDYLKYPVTALTATPSGEQPTQAPIQASAPVNQGPVQVPAQPDPQASTDPQTPSQISIRSWVTYPMVAPDQWQEIGVMVYENGAPMVGIEPDITLTLPDGNIRSYYMYPTGADGQSRLQLDPIAAPNMSLIPYEVCIFLVGGHKLCYKDTYMIRVTP